MRLRSSKVYTSEKRKRGWFFGETKVYLTRLDESLLVSTRLNGSQKKVLQKPKKVSPNCKSSTKIYTFEEIKLMQPKVYLTRLPQSAISNGSHGEVPQNSRKRKGLKGKQKKSKKVSPNKKSSHKKYTSEEIKFMQPKIYLTRLPQSAISNGSHGEVPQDPCTSREGSTHSYTQTFDVEPLLKIITPREINLMTVEEFLARIHGKMVSACEMCPEENNPETFPTTKTEFQDDSEYDVSYEEVESEIDPELECKWRR